MTHSDLINAAYEWVLKSTSCGMAFKELHTLCVTRETPDVIGFGAWGFSVLVECKTSRSDFLADKKKFFREHPEQGMGTRRFYCCPEGLIKQDELPTGWGLLYVIDGKAKCIFKPYKGNVTERTGGFEKNLLAEHGVMYSVLRRMMKGE